MSANNSVKSTRALVAHESSDGQPNLKLEDVTLRDLKDDELLVRIVATGVCHTDLIFATWPAAAGGPYPKVLGHEGAGYVESIGSSVKTAAVGDAVMLSFQSCASCKDCEDGHTSFCQKFAQINYGGEQEVFDVIGVSKSMGSFFGQSSFSNFTIVKESSTVRVTDLIKNEDELKLFAPMGCGFQTGVGTIDNLTAAGKKDTVVVFGLGGVGLSAIMAAKLKECSVIVGIDRIPERLELAKKFGATHTINTSDKDLNLIEEIQTLTSGNGSSITIDTTGNTGLIESGLAVTANRGQMIILGVPPPDFSLGVHLIAFMQTGKQLRGSIEGDVTPSEYIPKMIQWYREGKLPIDDIVKFYPVKDFELALAEMKSGAAIKPVLVW